jgi:hypothetical protein
MKRSAVSLTIALLFITLAVTGVLGFFQPFNLTVVAVHSLLGFLFIGSLALHLKNNARQLKQYFKSPAALWISLTITAITVIIICQPAPIKSLLKLSPNLGPAADRFELRDDKITYHYTPAPHYKMQLNFKGGEHFDPSNPPHIAIWLENPSRYHLKTLYHSSTGVTSKFLPYWHFKKSEYEKHKAKSEEFQANKASLEEDLDALSSATPNDSFDPADYIVPSDPENEKPFRLLIEINAVGDGNEAHSDQPSLIYAVQVDNRRPQTYQVLDLVGYPESTQNEEGESEWSLRYVDDTITTAHGLFDSAMLLIERSEPAP